MYTACSRGIPYYLELQFETFFVLLFLTHKRPFIPRAPRPNNDFPCSNHRFEAVGAFIIALMLMGAGYGIGNHSFETLREVAGGATCSSTPTRLTAVAAVISIVVKESLYRVCISSETAREYAL